MTDLIISELISENVHDAYNIEKSSLDAPWSESELASIIGAEDKFYYTALCGGNVVGIADFYKVLDECMIMNVAVSAQFRRHGIADALMTHLLNTASDLGCTFATLETAADNTAAVSLYKKHGFAENGRRRGYYHGTDALLFRKELNI